MSSASDAKAGSKSFRRVRRRGCRLLLCRSPCL